jgi:hypothetical protein
MMNGKGFGRKRSWPHLRYYVDIRLKGLRKNTKNLTVTGRRGQYLNPGPPEYEARVLTTGPRRSVATNRPIVHPP